MITCYLVYTNFAMNSLINKIKTWLVNFDKFKIDWLLSSDYSHVYLVLSACRILSDKLYCSH